MRIETERLIIRKIEEKDVEDLFKIYIDDELTKYFVSGADKSLEQTKVRVENIRFHWDKYGFGDFILMYKENSKVAGYGGLHYKIDDGNVNISYVIDKSLWGTGLAKEACLALLYYGFRILALNEIVAKIDLENINSIKSIEKCGFKLNKIIEWKGFKRLEYTMISKDFNDIHEELFSNIKTINI